jgi:phosphoglycerate dehydrogenase-like enzyme
VQPTIVVLDEVELGDEHSRRLSSLGKVVTYVSNPADDEETVARASDADILVVGWTTLSAAVLARLPRLKMISVWATGYDYVDVRAARQRGVVTTNVPAYAGRAVAELTVGLMISLARHIVPADRHVRGGEYMWRRFGGVELRGRTVGLVGLGDIGAEMARLAGCLGMRVVAHTRNPNPGRAAELGCTYMSLDTVLGQSDFVSLHIPLSVATEAIIGSAQLAMMKRHAYLINTARAGLVDQPALAEALRTGTIAGAALDDIRFPDDALASLPNVILTPHIGFFTGEALDRLGAICIDNVAAYLAGSPVNVVG